MSVLPTGPFSSKYSGNAAERKWKEGMGPNIGQQSKSIQRLVIALSLQRYKEYFEIIRFRHTAGTGPEL